MEEEELQFSPAPMYGDSVCTFGRGDSMTWYQIYQEFTKPDFPEDLPDRQVYIQVKWSKLHYTAAHPPIFPCAKIVEWILQRVDPENWVIWDHAGDVVAALKGQDAEVYYRIPARE